MNLIENNSLKVSKCDCSRIPNVLHSQGQL